MNQFLSVGSVHLQNQPSFYDGEGDLDLEYTMALTDPTPVILLQTGDLVQGLSL
jgi:tripeptidyl-peptidase I